MSKNNVPVLLIGLGGIGSAIVDRTYGKLKKEGELDFLEALVFDTDQAELSKLENIPNECKIQTSTDKSVKYVLDRDENAKLWFPSHRKVLEMQLMRGAGQIRATSRLALRAAMKQGKLNKVPNVKDKIYELGGNAHEKGIRIMLVTSMMGGTGSGMFLQLPLYIREIFQSKFSADTIEIQGVFLLPDVLKGSIDEKEKKNIYANAYAAMKELHAIILSLSGDDLNIELEYKPDQIEKTKDITIKTWPYDYCFIYDKEDSKGRVLSNIESYKQMVSDNLCSQVYGPISDRMYSHFINTIRETIRKNCRNIFGGLSMGKLIYPYEDICDYITYRVINENLKEQLLRINTSFKLKMEQYDRSKQAGNDMDKPILLEHYITEFDELSKENKFFKNIKSLIDTVNENGEVGSDRIEDYFVELEDKIEKEVNTFVDNNIQKITVATIDNKTETELRNIVGKTEDRFREFKKNIETRIDSKAETMANNDFELYDDEKESFFDTFLKRDGSYINPVGIRYILYAIKKQMEIEKNELDIEKIKKSLLNLEERKLDNPSKKIKNVQEALDRACKHNNFIDRLIFKSMKKFKQDYVDVSNKHYNMLIDYCTDVYKKAYYGKTLELINVLIEEYERMFTQFEDQIRGIDKKIEDMLNKHEDTQGKTNIYVLGSAKFKEEIWSSIPSDIKINSLSKVFPEKLHKYLKINCKQKIKNMNGIVTGYDYIFNNLIVKSCKDSLKDDSSINEMINMNIITAMEKEYEYAKKLGSINDTITGEQYIKDELIKIIDKTEPFAANSDEASDYSLWGINNNLRFKTESLSDEPAVNRIITDVSNSKLEAFNICDDETYSKYEIVYLHSRYGLLVSDFKKFYAGENGEEDGEYYTCYNNLIKNVVDDVRVIGRDIEITPHIDKRWHKTLPDLNDDVNKKVEIDRSKAFLVGLSCGYIEVQEREIGEDKKRIEFLRTLNVTPPMTINDAKKEKVQGNISKLYDGLKPNRDICIDIVNKISSDIDAIKNDDSNSENRSINEDKYIKKFYNTKINCFSDVNNVLDLIIKLYGECKNRNENVRYAIFGNILNSLFSIIEDVVGAYCGDDSTMIKENAKDVLNKIIKTSSLIKGIDEKSDDYLSTVTPIIKKIEEYEGR